MMRVIVLVGLGLLFPLGSARAVEDVANDSFATNAPSNANIANWTNGWVQPAVEPTGYTFTTGWNYVGSVDGNSAVYLGHGWVLTAAHVGTAAFFLNGIYYPLVANSTRTFGNADIILFQISPCPALPPLPLRTTDPTPSVWTAMFGWGLTNSARAPSWGYNAVTLANLSLPLTNNGVGYLSNDFLTMTQSGSGNNYQVITGDSGGGDFIYNPASNTWELAGVNEATVTDSKSRSYSAFVQLNTYQAQIAAIITPATDTPVMPSAAIGLLAGLLVLAGGCFSPGVQRPSKASRRG